MQPQLQASPSELKQKFFALQSPRDVADLLEIPYDKLIYHLYRQTDDDKYQ